MSTKPFWLLIVCLVVASGSALATCNNAIPRSTPDAAFIIHNDGTVTHIATGLMWMRCVLGQTLSGTVCGGSTMTYIWQDALQAADSYTFAGYTDWRLPNKSELASIVEWACNDPAINTVAFPNDPNGLVLSSSPYADNSNSAWTVLFFNGSFVNYGKPSSGNVRLVRGGQ